MRPTVYSHWLLCSPQRIAGTLCFGRAPVSLGDMGHTPTKEGGQLGDWGAGLPLAITYSLDTLTALKRPSTNTESTSGRPTYFTYTSIERVFASENGECRGHFTRARLIKL
jgi:hypothetical protein